MKIALSLGPFCMGGGANGFDFSRVWTDTRGLSGSELGILRIGQELGKLGHEVHFYGFAKGAMPTDWEGLRTHEYGDRMAQDFDAAVAWNECDVLHGMRARVRVVSLQINSIVGSPGPYVDAWLSPSEPHRARLQHHGGRWEVVPDGCDPDVYDRLFASGLRKIPGRVVWTSSPDRGLHWLLQEWPAIREAVPWATLKVFYTLRPWLDRFLHCPEGQRDIIEQGRRACYIEEAMHRLRGMGVEFLDSVSRNDIAEELAKSECLAYSCDTVIWSEGFSCSLMEACSASACPVSTAVDAFPHIYGDALDLVPMPLEGHIGEFRDQVIRALTDPAWREQRNSKARALAERSTWTRAAKRLEEVLLDIYQEKTGRTPARNDTVTHAQAQ